MNQKKKDEQQGKKLSRRGVIKAVAGGVAASAITGLTPVRAAFQAKTTGMREKQLLECTVGSAVRILMDPEVDEPPDLAAIYQRLGGKARFTISLLAETFGSRSMKVEGTYPLRARTAPDLKAMTKALEAQAFALVEKKVPGVGGRPVYSGDPKRGTEVVWIFESSPKFKASCHVENS